MARVKRAKAEMDLRDPDQLAKFLPIPGWKSKKNKWLPNLICLDEGSNSVIIGCFIGDHDDFSLNKKAVSDGMDSIEDGHRKEIFVALIGHKREEHDFSEPLSPNNIVNFKKLREVVGNLIVAPEQGRGKYEPYWWINENFEISSGRM